MRMKVEYRGTGFYGNIKSSIIEVDSLSLGCNRMNGLIEPKIDSNFYIKDKKDNLFTLNKNYKKRK